MSRAGLALALLCALGAARAQKRAESESIVSPVPFTFAARYGRSPDRLITPRHDRWMLSSRYGKRSSSSEEARDPQRGRDESPSLGGRNPPFLGEIETPLFLQWGNDEPLFKGGKEPPLFKDGAMLYCEYTGVMELYHCSKSRRPGLKAFERKSEGASSSQIEEF